MINAELSDITILAIDDEPFILSLLKKLLGEIGVGTVITAANGVEALEQLNDSTHKVDLVF